MSPSTAVLLIAWVSAAPLSPEEFLRTLADSSSGYDGAAFWIESASDRASLEGIGTDSLASNTTLSILSELKILQDNFPQLGLEELVRWATINGARALGEDERFGRIEPGLKPGLLLLQDLDLVNLKILPSTTVTRLL